MTSKDKYILVTGGLGYIGSHTVIELIKNGYKKIVIIDNLSNSKYKTLNIIKKITKRKIHFFKKDIRDKSINHIFKRFKINCVIHFAGLKSINESNKRYNLYFNNNVLGSLNLFKIMDDFKCKKIIFSSSANVYDNLSKAPYNENNPVKPSSNYGLTKVMIENFLEIYSKRNKNNWKVIILRYFNPIGAHPSGLLNENIKKAENIIPKLTKVLLKKDKKFFIWGNDYNTKDGTCLRDYVHVSDLANCHIKALNIIDRIKHQIINIGTGKAYSVKDLIKVFSKVMKRKIPYSVGKRRIGDVPINYADISKSKKILKKNKYKNLIEMVKNIKETIRI
tara:strand:+ start:2726 stop:3730 length:1005 start_codon:yes stop_codon:yes gene_type:complete